LTGFRPFGELATGLIDPGGRKGVGNLGLPLLGGGRKGVGNPVLARQLFTDLLRVFFWFVALGVPLLLWLTPPPAEEFVHLCLVRDVYAEATARKAKVRQAIDMPWGPSPVRLFAYSAGGPVPAAAHAATGRLPLHQPGLIQSFPRRIYGLRVPAAEGEEIWGEATLPTGYYQMKGSWSSSLRWTLSLAFFYLLLLGYSLKRLRRIRGRLARLGETARRMAAGELAASYSAEPDDPAEIGYLSERLQQMGLALQQRHEQLISQRSQLDQAARERNLRLAEVSHDLRTPLTSILGFAQLYRDQFSGGLPCVETQGQALLDRVGQWLESCRMESGMLEVCLGEVYLNEVLEEAFERAQHGCPLKVQVNLPPKSPVVEADSFLLVRVLARLMLELRRETIGLAVEPPQLHLTGGGAVLGETDPAWIRLETCGQLLARQGIRLEQRPDGLTLIWERPWKD